MGATLLFWGWQTGHAFIGAAAGAVLESSRFLKLRWSLTQADFNRLWNICVVLFLAVGTFLLINEGTVSLDDFFADAGRRPEAMRQAGRSALIWFQWFPMIFLPFMLAQAFNEQPRVGLAAFSWWLRKQEARNSSSTLPRETVDVSFGYLALCLLSASATTHRPEYFYFGFVALIAWALFAVRLKQQSLVAWSLVFAVVATAGYGGHHGMQRLQKKLEEMNVRWFMRIAAPSLDDKQARTRMGTIGRLKNSDRIVLRLRTDGTSPAPEYLRETSFNLYRGRIWSVERHEPGSIISEADDSSWIFLRSKASRYTMRIAGYFPQGKGLLPLPSGSSEVFDLPVGGIATNRFGGAIMDGGPGMAMFQTRYDSGATFDSAPTADDMRRIDNEPAVVQVARNLGLDTTLSTEDAMQRVKRYLAENFSYASYLTREHAATRRETVMTRFLLHTRSGHCEYFATAAALLLREAGVPTRYAVGYSVQEGKGNKYVVRERHGHAWTLVWNGQHWIDFDTTPADWNALEGQQSSWLRPIKDFFSELWFQFSKFRWGKTEWRKWFMLAPVPLLVVVLVRFFFGKQWRKRRADRRAQAAASRAGIDSDFYLIEKHFAARGLAREAGENWSQWLRRIEQHEVAAGRLRRVLLLHQRHRFDPRGLNAEERDELRRAVAAWMDETRATRA